VRARRRFAQHFLEPAWVAKLVDVVAPQREDDMIEIGPGRGAVTVPLAARVRQLLAIEVDRDLARELEARGIPNVSVRTANVLDTDLAVAAAEWRGRPLSPADPVRVVGNLPYNVASPILFKLFELAAATRGVPDAIVMLQKEVADRLLARPGTGEYGVLTILAAFHADSSRLLSLPPGAFRPSPRVHSAVVRLTFRPSPVLVRDADLLTRMVRGMFTQRRKTLLNALRPFGDAVGVASSAALARAGLDPRRRPETLQLVEIARLADSFAEV
jgi:16S rRNA (adenine1518-N6/adenine1519-N6)-dimethyltransferase